jgi:hypothetical protein
MLGTFSIPTKESEKEHNLPQHQYQLNPEPAKAGNAPPGIPAQAYPKNSDGNAILPTPKQGGKFFQHHTPPPQQGNHAPHRTCKE